MKQLFYGISVATIVTSHAHALQELPWADHQETSVSISNHEVTRIAVKDDRISNVLGFTMEDADIETENDTGQLFIQPKVGITKPLHLTLITETGRTHDLKLTPLDKEEESILFVHNKEEKKTEIPASSERGVYIMNLIRISAQGQIPEGFHEAGKASERKLSKDLEHSILLMPLKRFISEEQDLAIHLYLVSPRNLDAPLPLDEKAFAEIEDIALSFDHSALKNDQTMILIVIRNGEQDHAE